MPAGRVVEQIAPAPHPRHGWYKVPYLWNWEAVVSQFLERHLHSARDVTPRIAAEINPAEDLALVVSGIRDLMAMPSAGDLVIYGLEAGSGHVSYVREAGAHAGPTADEMHTFIITPPGVSLPQPITHPIQLYPHFDRYQDAAA